MSEKEQQANNEKTAQKKTWEAPRILSDEPLEAAAATCNGAGGYGKSVPQCNPQTLGS
ncbi:hypothetical protein [Thiolapillus brandeum]|uniref:hypothetical protein n=1 Tax=Thiolapillus brandeum TaxID=1076588 RepID=UPI0012B5E0FB|nr:hypothetical protein [Thiolapillus brandeum]